MTAKLGDYANRYASRMLNRGSKSFQSRNLLLLRDTLIYSAPIGPERSAWDNRYGKN